MLPVSSRSVQRIVVILTALTLAMAPMPAAAREFRAADTQAEDYPTVQALRLMGRMIAERSGGRDQIRVFHSRQLGEEKETIEQPRAGAGLFDERHRQHVHRRHVIADQRAVGTVEVDRAGAGLFDGLLFLAELPGLENADLVAAAAAFRDHPPHQAQRLNGWIVLGLGVSGAELTGGSRHGRHRPRQRSQDDYNPLNRAAGHRQHPPEMESLFRTKGSSQSSRMETGMAIRRCGIKGERPG